MFTCSWEAADILFLDTKKISIYACCAVDEAVGERDIFCVTAMSLMYVVGLANIRPKNVVPQA